MTKVAIVSVTSDQGDRSYHAVAGTKQSLGVTAGAALDALTAQFTEEELGSLVIVQHFRPDRFFSAAQQQRLALLMNRWRIARDQNADLPAAEQAELVALIDAEVAASAKRAAALAADIDR